MSPPLFLFRFYIWRSFKNKSDAFHVLRVVLFILDVTHIQVDVETEFGVVFLSLGFYELMKKSRGVRHDTCNKPRIRTECLPENSARHL